MVPIPGHIFTSQNSSQGYRERLIPTSQPQDMSKLYWDLLKDSTVDLERNTCQSTIGDRASVIK